MLLINEYKHGVLVFAGVPPGDLSIGDPGFSGSAAVGGEGGAEWWSADGELLSAPKRMTGRGVNYQRSAKQVCAAYVDKQVVPCGFISCMWDGTARQAWSVHGDRGIGISPCRGCLLVPWSACSLLDEWLFSC
jgi:hypothetical protein